MTSRGAFGCAQYAPCPRKRKQELIALGYDMSGPCDRFGRTPEVVAERHDQGAALALVRHSLACLDIQRLVRGFLGRRKAKRIKAAWGRAEKKEETAAAEAAAAAAEEEARAEGAEEARAPGDDNLVVDGDAAAAGGAAGGAAEGIVGGLDEEM